MWRKGALCSSTKPQSASLESCSTPPTPGSGKQGFPPAFPRQTLPLPGSWRQPGESGQAPARKWRVEAKHQPQHGPPSRGLLPPSCLAAGLPRTPPGCLGPLRPTHTGHWSFGVPAEPNTPARPPTPLAPAACAGPCSSPQARGGGGSRRPQGLAATQEHNRG